MAQRAAQQENLRTMDCCSDKFRRWMAGVSRRGSAPCFLDTMAGGIELRYTTV